MISEILKLWFSSFFSKCSKFCLNFKAAMKIWQKAFNSLHKRIWVGCKKFSLLEREYLSLAVNMLTNSSNILYLTKKDVFPSHLISQWWKSRTKEISCWFQHCCGPANTLNTEECSETVPFRHLSNHIFWRQQFRKYLTYETNVFFKMFQYLCGFRNCKKIWQKVLGFLDNYIWISYVNSPYYDENTCHWQSLC